MGKSAKIRRLIQKIAIVLAVILALPQMPMAQRMGLGYVEAHAEPETGKKDLVAPGVSCVISDDKNTASLIFFYNLVPDTPISGGAVKYEYCLSTSEGEIGEEDWVEIADGQSCETSYIWTIADEVKGKEFTVSALFYDDVNYKDVRVVSWKDLEEPVINSISDVTKTDNNYSFTITLDKSEVLEGAYYYYILTPYNENGYGSVTRENVVDEVLNQYEIGDNSDQNNTYFGYGELPLGLTEIQIIADGSDFSSGVYVFQVVVEDASQNLSTKVVSNPFITDDSEVAVPDHAPTLNVSVSEDKTKYIVSVDTSSVTNGDNKTIEYSFDGESYGETRRYEANAGEEVTAYIRFAADENTVASTPVSATITTSSASATPTLTAMGSFATEKTVEIKAANENDIIYYTTNGNEPTLESATATGRIELNISTTTTVKAFAIEAGKIKSTVASATYTYVEAPDNDPLLTVLVSEDYSKYVIIADPTPITGIIGKSIEYSFNNGQYSTYNEYEAKANEEVVIATRFGGSSDTVPSSPRTKTIKMDGASLSPTLTASGSFATTKKVEITAGNANDIIYYTIDGSEPTLESATAIGRIELNISATTAVKAFAIEAGKIKSTVASATYSKVDAPDHAPALDVSVSDDKAKYIVTVNTTSVTNKTGKTIEYSFDGVTYGETNTYEAAAEEAVTAYIRFAATDSTVASAPVSATITTSSASATPTLTAMGSFATEKTVEIKAANENDIIYYTTNGNEPTLESATATGRIELNISATTTVKAFVIEAGKIKSDVVSATYTFVEAPDNAPVLNVSVSEDKTKYIVSVDTSSVTNKDGKVIEYSFDGENYGTTNTYVADAEETVTAYIRFTATTNTVASLSRSSTTTTPGKSATPTLSKGGSFLTEKMSIDIIGTNVSDLIYYTTNNDDPTELSLYANGSIILENISSTTTVKAFAVENGKIRSDIVTATYTKITPTVTGVENDRTYNSKRTITIDKASNTTVTLKKDNEEPNSVTLINGSASIEVSGLGIYVLKLADELGNEKSLNFAIAQEEITITAVTDVDKINVTFDPSSTIDVSTLFNIPANAGTTTYSIVNGETESAGEGTLAEDGKTLIISKAGTITIKVNTAGSDYVAPSEQTVNLSIAKAEGVLNIDVKDAVYGETINLSVNTNTNNGEYTVEYAGRGTTTYATSLEAPKQVGTYTVTVTCPENDLYKEVVKSADYVISPATLTITANDRSKKVEEEDPELTYSVTGLVYNDTISNVLIGELSREEGETVKTYAISQGSLKSNNNYNIVFNGAIFTITSKDSYNVSVTKSDDNSGDITGDGSYEEGSKVTLTAKANSGYKFIRWEEENTSLSDTNELSFVIDKDRTLKAVFSEKESPVLSISVSSWTYGDSSEGKVVVSGNIEGGAEALTYYTDPNYTVKTKTYNGATVEGGVPSYSGTYYVKVTVAETENYKSGSAQTSFTIAGITSNSYVYYGNQITKGMFTIKDAEYTGNAIQASITAEDNGKVLYLGTDFDVVYENNINAGMAKVIISGKGNYYGSVEIEFLISPKSVTEDMFEVEDVDFTGKVQEPDVIGTDGEKALVSDRDFTVAFKDNTNVGTATATITGKGNYTGSVDVTFEILGKSIQKATVSGLKSVAYTGKAITPAVTVKLDGKTLKKGTDYTVKYANNIKVGTATVTITGKGDYSGTLKKSFKIKKANLKYRAYVQKKNWMTYQVAQISGTKASSIAGTTDNLRMETIQIRLSGVNGDLKYRAYVQKKGWTQWGSAKDESSWTGTKGQSLRLEMIQLQASGEFANIYDIYYRAYCEKFGWLGWAKSGEKAGSAGYGYKLEAFQINIVPKGQAFSLTSPKSRCFYDKTKDGANPK